jgi:hypothetical protein
MKSLRGASASAAHSRSLPARVKVGPAGVERAISSSLPL